MLAAHPQLSSFPETHFWIRTIREKPYFRLPKLYAGRDKKVVSSYLQKYDFPLEAMADMKSIYYTGKGWSNALLNVLDNIADEQTAGWVEKTPFHLLRISSITAADPEVKFIHIIRSGKDVIASLYDVTHNYPQHWGGEPYSIDKCIAIWKKCIRRSLRYLKAPQHHFVNYDELVETNEQILRRLTNFLGLEYVSTMGSAHTQAAQNVVGNFEKWKRSNVEGRSRIDKFTKSFNPKEQQKIKNSIQEISLEPFINQ